MGLIGTKLVDRLLRNTTQYLWEHLELVFMEARKLQPSDQYPHYDSTDYLYNRIKGIGKQHAQH